MKCIKCNADIEQDAQFCPNCGKEVKQEDTLQPYQKKSFSKKALWIVCSIAVIALLLFGVKALFSSSSINNDDSVFNKVDIENRLNEIYGDVLNNEADAEKKYCSKEFVRLKENFEIAYEKSTIDGIMGPDYDYWTMHEDGGPYSMKVEDIKEESSNKATAIIQITDHFYNNTENVELSLVYENNNWFIDDFTNNGNSVRKIYSDDLEVCKENEFQIDDAEFGECYKIGDVNCLSYKQMKYITKNQLTQGQIDLVASKINFTKHFNPNYKVYYYQGANEDNTFYIEIDNDKYIFSCSSKIGDWDYIESVSSDLLSEDSTAIALWSDGIHFKETHGNGYNKIKVEGHSSEGLFVKMSGTPNYFDVVMHK